MNSRITHYFKKADLALKNQGVVGLIKVAANFLIRRKFLLEFPIESLDYHLLSRFRAPEKTILQVWKNAEILSDRVVLYASFDQSSFVSQNVFRQLNAFRDAGYAIVFVTTSDRLEASDLKHLDAVAAIVIHRRNIGYDFASWQVGYKFIQDKLPGLKSLIVMNDSCEGPAFDLSLILEKMLAAQNSIYGISISTEIYEHIQSYFYHFGSGVIAQGVVEGFFNRVRSLRSKWTVVRYLEIGSARYFAAQKVRIEALIDSRNPSVKLRMEQCGITEPTREPLATEWVEKKINPFYKRSNLKP